METKRSLEETSWKEIRHRVIEVNPEFAQCIDEVSPSENYPLFKATYFYGDQLVIRGKSYLPTPSGHLAPMTDPEISDYIREHLSYNLYSNPVSLLLSKSLELFLPLEDNMISLYGLMPIKPGVISGTWRVLNPTHTNHPSFLWNMTAGSRSIFMLPKISDSRSHHKLQKEFGIRSEVPNSLLDHWQIFREIANSSEISESDPWKMEVIFFSRKWFEHLKDSAWKGFYNYLLDKAFNGSEYLRNQFVWDLVFSIIRKTKNIKPHAYIADIVKNLLSIGVGGVPGFAPALNNEQAPIKTIQKAYIDIYKLKEYCPVILQPTLFSMDPAISRSVYYLLNFPMSIEFSPKTNMKISNIADLCMIRNLLTTYLNEISSNKLNISETPYYAVCMQIEYKLFHSNSEQYYEIFDTSKIPTEDPSFLTSLIENNENTKFPHDSSVIKGGCIRIQKK